MIEPCGDGLQMDVVDFPEFDPYALPYACGMEVNSDAPVITFDQDEPADDETDSPEHPKARLMYAVEAMGQIDQWIAEVEFALRQADAAEIADQMAVALAWSDRTKALIRDAIAGDNHDAGEPAYLEPATTG